MSLPTQQTVFTVLVVVVSLLINAYFVAEAWLGYSKELWPVAVPNPNKVTPLMYIEHVCYAVDFFVLLTLICGLIVRNAHLVFVWLIFQYFKVLFYSIVIVAWVGLFIYTMIMIPFSMSILTFFVIILISLIFINFISYVFTKIIQAQVTSWDVTLPPCYEKIPMAYERNEKKPFI